MRILGLRSERCQAQHWLKNVSACTAPVLEYRLCIYLGHKTVKVRDLLVFIDQSLCIVYSELISYHGLAHNLPIEAVLTLPFLGDQKFFK